MNKLKMIAIFIYWDIIYRIFCIFPIQDKIFFESFLGKDYSDNPKYIYIYLRDKGYNYKYIWSFKAVKTVCGATAIKKMSLRYAYEVATSKYIINNSRMPLKWKKRKQQKYIQTWHGTPLKRLVYDMEYVTLPDTNKKNYFLDFSKDVNKWDYLISPNDFSTKIFKSAFKYKGQIIKSGYPRNEDLYAIDIDEVAKIKQTLGLEAHKKIVLYAPTFRDNKYVSKNHYIQEIRMDIQKIKELLGGEVNFILRAHYLVKDIESKYLTDDIIDLSSYGDINDLYKISDLLITDYSSVFFDYMSLKKPIVFYQYDQKEYKEHIRDFYINIEDLPSKVVTNEESLYKELESLDLSEKVNYEEFIQKFNLETYSRHSSKIIIKEILGEKK